MPFLDIQRDGSNGWNFLPLGDNQIALNVRRMVAGGFTPKRCHTHGVSTHINSTNNQVLKISLALTEQKRHCGHNETKSRKTCLFVVLQYIEGEGKLEIQSL